MTRVAIIICILICLAGCETMPIKNGELVVGKDTTAGIEDIGVAAINKKF